VQPQPTWWESLTHYLATQVNPALGETKNTIALISAIIAAIAGIPGVKWWLNRRREKAKGQSPENAA